MAHTPAPSAFEPEAMHRAMLDSPAYRSLPAAQQTELSQSMARVFDFLNAAPAARAMAPDLSQLRSSGGGNGGSGYGGGYAGAPQPASGTPPAPAAAPVPGAQTAIERAPGATAAMLQAIDFPSFVASLVQGTFQAIVDASIQQMEAYATLLREAVKDIDGFMSDNVSPDTARDHLANTYGDVFTRNLAGGKPKLEVVKSGGAQSGQLPTFLQNLGFDSPLDIDDQSMEQVVVPETQRSLAEMRHQTLATMVMMGINRVVVSDGEIAARLIFHVDASEKIGMTFEENKPTSWTYAAQLGRNPFAASGIVVQTTNVNAQQDLNIRADLTGEVKIRFRSETFPLDRFADTAAIQLINNHAKPFPPREPASPAGGQEAGSTVPPAPAPSPATTHALAGPALPPRVRTDAWEPST